MRFFKFILTFLGGIFIGFGTGLIIVDKFVFSETNSWLASVAGLVLGGFLMAFSIAVGTKKKEKIKAQESLPLTGDFSKNETHQDQPKI